MTNFNKQNGVTMVALISTVVVLLILSSIGVNMGLKSIDNIKNSKLVSELEMVQHAVLEQYTKYKATKDPVYLVGNKITYEEATKYAKELGVILATIPDSYTNKEYYRLDKASLVAMGIKDATDEYIINYISGEVMNITVKRISNGNPLYTKANSF